VSEWPQKVSNIVNDKLLLYSASIHDDATTDYEVALKITKERSMSNLTQLEDKAIEAFAKLLFNSNQQESKEQAHNQCSNILSYFNTLLSEQSNSSDRERGV